ncbi:beta-N-acetylglucosaminidase domain-containing protein [Virgibacillus halodenitrificans]|uniref:beta-N-acetylglucosaminidase domain-containing protein n=1 Tax=Virgibacillus halodenitrificans TaxID=1482 RepID=UPI002DBB76CE|nr:beta-N-acetylglucosaminidase domain-containing protein [Virgibacillus halodenitrificans]MEC2158261.1 beta-N-acetylglucosaminidase domain-containing protein [Virgibacillus halodenitrificans]
MINLVKNKKENGRRILCSFPVIFILTILLTSFVLPNHSAYADDEGEQERTITVNPQPQEIEVGDDGFPLPPVVGIVVGENADEAALNELKNTLKNAGVKRMKVQEDNEKIHAPVTIFLGVPSMNEETEDVLDEVDTDDLEEMKDEGYVLVTNKDKKQILLAGTDKAGTYYATQTFRQLIQERKGRNWIPEVEVTDWPEMKERGIIEGFYGPTWSHEDRLSQLDFYGDNKLNSYMYAPKDDPYHREDWRKPYPENKLKELKELINKSKENHVEFTFSLSPGNTVCYSGDKDFELLMDKMDTMWELGVHSYAIFLDDISYELHCEQDKEKFGDDANPTAAAQAYFLNRFKKEFIDTHEGAEQLITVPTDYAGTHTNTYRERFAELTEQDMKVMWTGPNVVSESITSEGAKKVSDIFNHELLLWDNYPVNDFDRNRLFLGPLEKRDADLVENGVSGLIANPMNEAEASKIPLYTVADYAWNPYEYDPKQSWENSIQSFGGEASEYLRTFAENSYSSRLSDTESLTIYPLLEDFWKVYEANGEAEKQAEALIKEFQKLQQVPEKLSGHMENEKFLQEVEPYLNKLKLYGEAGVIAVNLLMEEKEGDNASAEKHRKELQAMIEKLDEIPQEVGKFVLEPFLIQAIYGEYVLSRPLDGINQGRGADQLIQYTPEHGKTTGTNIYGYEVTVVDGKVVERGGNNSEIPTNGYVLSIHGSDWLMENAVLGAEVEIKDQRVLITIPK